MGYEGWAFVLRWLVGWLVKEYGVSKEVDKYSYGGTGALLHNWAVCFSFLCSTTAGRRHFY